MNQLQLPCQGPRGSAGWPEDQNLLTVLREHLELVLQARCSSVAPGVRGHVFLAREHQNARFQPLGTFQGIRELVMDGIRRNRRGVQ
jgi:hypothetical protein